MVLVIGSANIDMIAHAQHLPMPGETLTGERFAMESGGKGANQAVAAARLGARAALIARIGTREHGDTLLAALAAEAVDDAGIVRDANSLPGIAVINVASEDGENAIVYVPGSNADLSAADVRAHAALIALADVVVAPLEVPLPAVQAGFELARASGGITMLNAAPALPVPDELLQLTDWLVLNETEVMELAGPYAATSIESAALALLQRGPGHVLVTLGAEGVLLCDPAGMQRLPARTVRAVDTVGAGDTFVGAFAVGLAEGLPPFEALRLGQAAAALAVSRSGVQRAMPQRAELSEFLAALAPTAAAPRLKVIFDTDPGIDDAMALYVLARHPGFELQAVTTVFGNASVDVTTRNAQALCAKFGIEAPVARGAADPLQPNPALKFSTHVHGDDALGGAAGLLPEARRPLDARPAHELICERINAEPGEITLIAVGPLSNLALALQHDPGITAKVKQVIVMGGAFGLHGHGGNVTPVAEANISSDPLAADLVLGAAWPVVIVGLDVTQQILMDEAYLSSLQGRGAGAGDFFWQATRAYQDFYQERTGFGGIYSHDASAVIYAIAPSAFTLREGPVRVVLDGLARGQTIQDTRKPLGLGQLTPWSQAAAQQVCVDVDASRVLDIFLKLFA